MNNLLNYILVAFLVSHIAIAQQLGGTITDADSGIPLPGATVLVKGITNGTTTDFDGLFQLDNVSSDAILVISYIGYETQEVAINNNAHWSFKLVRDLPLVGSWKLAPESGASGFGPGKDDVSWWSNTTGDVTTRACLFDDKYIFNSDGSFKNDVDTESWIETWQGATADGCAAPVFPHDGTATAHMITTRQQGPLRLQVKALTLAYQKHIILGSLPNQEMPLIILLILQRYQVTASHLKLT